MNNDKYIKKSLVQRYFKGVNITQHDLLSEAESMTSVEELRSKAEAILRSFETGGIDSHEAFYSLHSHIKLQPEKFAGLTTEYWHLLNKHPYVYVECEDFNKKFLNNVTNYKSIRKLLPDPEGMTRTDMNIPNGIKVELTFLSGSISDAWKTPINHPEELDIKHYRIIGIADSEVSGE